MLLLPSFVFQSALGSSCRTAIARVRELISLSFGSFDVNLTAKYLARESIGCTYRIYDPNFITIKIVAVGIECSEVTINDKNLLIIY